ncbi:GNAT family N-acetyltransferase [Acidovorax facilis]|uniref:GNAT family N-acetyltransferase n=1 Tax=Acidovorax TaxID=12916 RepID=UPI00338ECE00
MPIALQRDPLRDRKQALRNGYLSMLVVAPAFRGRGLGRALVQQALVKAPAATWVLRAGRPGASEFFARMGFAPSAIAMERARST